MRKRVLILLAAAALSCGRDETKQAAVAAPLVTLKINLTPSISNGHLMIAKDEGDFAREGLDLSFVTIDNNAANFAITNGGLDVFAAPMRTGVFNLIARGEPLQIVADKGHSEPGPCSPEAFTAPAAMAERVAAKGFRGERVALVRGGIMEYLIDRMLERDRLTREDVEFVQLPQGDYASSSKQQVEAVRYMMEPVLSSALARGDTAIVAAVEHLAPGTQLSMIVFGPRLLQKEPELGTRFLRAYLRGIARYNEGKTDRNVAIISQYTKLPPEIVRRACWPRIAADGAIDPAAVTPFLAWARKAGYMEKDVPLEAWWNPSFLQAARR